uniref:Transposase IS204/IS1001/IS1096/IS1165 DDE domain-containing protein n=1 Tax=uncultured Desulfobacterium sp. TaxID=201089 RepID=E1YEK3_9BACT|nr:hypothetical protein N47_P17020 [uncultured Desulfobacterium sp.]
MTLSLFMVCVSFPFFWSVNCLGNNQPMDTPPISLNTTFDYISAETFLNKWYFWATHSRLEPIKKAAYTMKRHWNGILRWFTSRINNGILEGINSLIQAAKAKARGYSTIKNLITMIYLIGGKLEFRLPT